VAKGEALVLDTRIDRSGFMAKHIPGALHAPLNKSFNTAVGSLVEDETRPIVLVVEEAGVEEAVRDLVRIGYDNVVGFVTPETLTRYFDRGGSWRPSRRSTLPTWPAGRTTRTRWSSTFASPRSTPPRTSRARNASYTRLPSYVRRSGSPGDASSWSTACPGGRSAAAAAFLAREGFDVAFVNGNFESLPRGG
jgi:hydroxyacylglutathione hydrolase